MSFEPPLPPYNSTDPSATFLASSCLDLLLIELVPMAYRLVNEVDQGVHGGAEDNSTGKGSQDRNSGEKVAAGEESRHRRQLDEDEERDAVFFRLESLGYRVGQGLVER